MGVHNLWKVLAKGGAVQSLDGSRPGEHSAIVDAVSASLCHHSAVRLDGLHSC
jgi:hypothetical protein